MQSDVENPASDLSTSQQEPRPFSLLAKYAIALTLLPLALIGLSILLPEGANLGFPAFVFGLLAPLVSLAAIVHILKSKSRGLVTAIICFLISLVFYIVIPLLMIPHMRMLYSCMACGTQLKGIGNGLDVYQKECGGAYPDPNRWCDLLIEKADVSSKTFSLDEYKGGISFVALNPECRPDSPPDTVLAFECRPGWNQHGGPELLDPNRHEGTGCNFLFRDLRVQFVKGRQSQLSLRWNPDPNSTRK